MIVKDVLTESFSRAPRAELKTGNNSYKWGSQGDLI